ncbi:conserved hypothetical protein [Candidatus Nitrotoga fabula]|uniref:Uncharacterized protein n=1 Tax=Candidatus Nitrotoga fabula TaxID=2182327 RepID=A0A916BE04_9PROT|nr:conserved hypothetical protein [Candidatus Nitrotoga fabula]
MLDSSAKIGSGHYQIYDIFVFHEYCWGEGPLPASNIIMSIMDSHTQ